VSSTGSPRPSACSTNDGRRTIAPPRAIALMSRIPGTHGEHRSRSRKHSPPCAGTAPATMATAEDPDFPRVRLKAPKLQARGRPFLPGTSAASAPARALFLGLHPSSASPCWPLRTTAGTHVHSRECPHLMCTRQSCDASKGLNFHTLAAHVGRRRMLEHGEVHKRHLHTEPSRPWCGRCMFPFGARPREERDLAPEAQETPPPCSDIPQSVNLS
jgi:hypothetical protein